MNRVWLSGGFSTNNDTNNNIERHLNCDVAEMMVKLISIWIRSSALFRLNPPHRSCTAELSGWPLLGLPRSLRWLVSRTHQLDCRLRSTMTNFALCGCTTKRGLCNRVLLTCAHHILESCKKCNVLGRKGALTEQLCGLWLVKII